MESPVHLTTADLQRRWRKSAPTIGRMLRDGRLPPKDFYLGGQPVGWRIETIETIERGGK
jgi:hypothetical protein